MNISLQAIPLLLAFIACFASVFWLVNLGLKRLLKKRNPGATVLFVLTLLFGFVVNVVLLYLPLRDVISLQNTQVIKIDAFEYYADTAEEQGKSYDAGGAHITYFLGWAIERGFAAHALGFDKPQYASEPELMGKQALETIAKFKQQGDEGIGLLIGDSEWLMSSMLKPEAASFAVEQFRVYTSDYFNIMKREYGSEIQEISAARYKRSKQQLDQLFEQYTKSETAHTAQ